MEDIYNFIYKNTGWPGLQKEPRIDLSVKAIEMSPRLIYTRKLFFIQKVGVALNPL